MIKVGLTGGIGSGKSTVAKVFATLGVPVYIADLRAKLLMNRNEQVISRIKQAFGSAVYDENGLNKAYLAELIFRDKEKLQLINSIVHPAVEEDFKRWSMSQKSFYVIKESAILFETGKYKQLDCIITVSAPLELRIERVCRRDGVSREKVLERIANQMNEQERISLADYIIVNDEESFVLPQVLNLHNFFLKQSL